MIHYFILDSSILVVQLLSTNAAYSQRCQQEVDFARISDSFVEARVGESDPILRGVVALSLPSSIEVHVFAIWSMLDRPVPRSLDIQVDSWVSQVPLGVFVCSSTSLIGEQWKSSTERSWSPSQNAPKRRHHDQGSARNSAGNAGTASPHNQQRGNACMLLFLSLLCRSSPSWRKSSLCGARELSARSHVVSTALRLVCAISIMS